MFPDEAERFRSAELRKIVIRNDQIPLAFSQNARQGQRSVDAPSGYAVSAPAQLVQNQLRVVLRVFDEDETKRFVRVSWLLGQTGSPGPIGGVTRIRCFGSGEG